MTTQKQHAMQRVTARGAGEEEWVCATCGRRLLLRTQPVFTATVIAAGDTRATHYGGALANGSAPGRPRSEPAAALDEIQALPDHDLRTAADEVDRNGGGAGDDGDLSLELLRPWLKALKAIEEEGFGEL